MIVLACGGRRFDDRAFVFRTLDEIERARGPIRGLIHGCAQGADRIAAEWQRERIAAAGTRHELWIAGVPANWNAHGKAAGPIRNQEMLDRYKPQIVIAFPGGSGTADMMRRAKLSGIEIFEATPRLSTNPSPGPER